MTGKFDEVTWRSRVADWWREAASDLSATAGSLGVRTAYGLLTASAWLPLLAAYGSDPGAAVTALVSVVSGVGSNLVANLVQGTYDRATAPQKAEQEVAERPDLRPEYQRLLDRLDVVGAAQGALGDGWADFEARLHEELARFGGTLHIDSGGGTVVLGDVRVQYGDFVGRDQIIQIYPTAPAAEHRSLRGAYLRHLAAECSRLPLGVVDPRFLQTGPQTPVPLTEIYVDLDVVAPVRETGEKREGMLLARLAKGEGGERTALLEAIAHPEVTCLVLLGDPGSGKTTFVHYLTYALAVSIGTDGLSPFLPSGSPLQGMLPVRLVLREVTARCIPSGATRGEACMLWDAMKLDIAARLGEKAADTLFPVLQRQLLEEGGLVLLDGLDEVPEADRRRKCLLEAVEDLAASLPDGCSRVVVTARPYAYVDPGWQLPGFQTLVLAPFDEDQVVRFVQRWYQAVRPVMGWDAVTAQAREDRLVEALAERPYLADLASRPLLLTLMATLHTSWGQLPEDRADLYEETVKLLLGRWQRAREIREPGGGVVVEPGIARVLAVGDKPLRTALHRLAFQAHEAQAQKMGREAVPADIGQAQVLAAFAPLLPEDFHPQVLLNYLETRAGLLVDRAPGVYAFPHRSFQEYLAACHLADGQNFASELRDRLWRDLDWWRAVFLLGVGKAKQGGLDNAVHVINTLVPEGPEEIAAPSDTHWQTAILAGQALLDLHFPVVGQEQPHFETVLKRVRRWLVALLELSQKLSPRERAEGGDVLGHLGDPRPGVGVVTSSERALPQPDILWVEVPAGPFRMGSAEDDETAWADERPQHTVDLPAFLVSRYPITNAQYRPFVEGGGYDEPHYWTEEGWTWRNGQKEPDLSPLADVEDEEWKRNYAEWLARRTVERRRRPFWWDHPRWGLDNRPVVGISWYEAMAYCIWLTEVLQAGGWKLAIWRNGGLSSGPLADHPARGVRLPSEAEWEKAARGPLEGLEETHHWPWGHDWVEGRANTEEAGIGETSAVGSFPAGASPCGALDMAGNVWEWTRSRWGRTSAYRPDYGYPYEPGDGREDPGGPDLRVVRGGSWDDNQRDARCAYRYWLIPDFHSYNLGVRVVVSLASSES